MAEEPENRSRKHQGRDTCPERSFLAARSSPRSPAAAMTRRTRRNGQSSYAAPEGSRILPEPRTAFLPFRPAGLEKYSQLSPERAEQQVARLGLRGALARDDNENQGRAVASLKARSTRNVPV